jgi:hypothetical protein
LFQRECMIAASWTVLPLSKTTGKYNHLCHPW